MIIYQDNYIIAVNKPNNTLVHHSKMADNTFSERSLVQIVQQDHGLKAYPIHRLDRKTSGIVLFARERSHVSTFQELFVAEEIQKVYMGIVRGFIPLSGKVDSDVKGRDAQKYKSALTLYERLNTITLPIAVTPYEESRYSLVKLLPKTGRLHQLRIHMNKISHPLIGDPKYGDRFHNGMFATEFNCSTLFLHAYQLEFVHPFLEQRISITAPFPKDWISICEKFNWKLGVKS